MGNANQERWFSICRDETAHDAREAHGLSEILDPIVNQGVAAYVAPQWPVDVKVAKDLAVSFQKSPLANRLSLSES